VATFAAGTPAWPQAGSTVVQWPLLAAGFLLVMAIVVAVMLLLRRRAADQEDEGPPPLLFPSTPGPRRRPIRPMHPAPSLPQPPPTGEPRQAVPVAAQPRPVETLVGASGGGVPVADPLADPKLVDGTTIRFYSPGEGTLQIIPGRLDIVSGADRGKTIRFVRTGDLTQVSFGRSDGPPYRHVQLRAPTVSRNHALMSFDNTNWSIRNLSRTNPVVVNGKELGVDGNALPLREGDRIEMGELSFVFRER
jgi:hypothetical protein